MTTQLDMLKRVLKKAPNARLSPERLATELGWSIDQLRLVLERARKANDASVKILAHGVVQFLGGEGTHRDKEIFYGQIAKNLKKFLVKERWISDEEARVTGHQRQEGNWTMPDMVIAGHTPWGRSFKYEKQLHVIEAEFPTKFSVQSLYQAHSVARGADYAWVVCDAADWAGVDADHLDYICRTTGVGCITFTNSNASTTYRMQREATLLNSDDAHREAFTTRTLRKDDLIAAMRELRPKARPKTRTKAQPAAESAPAPAAATPTLSTIDDQPLGLS